MIDDIESVEPGSRDSIAMAMTPSQPRSAVLLRGCVDGRGTTLRTVGVDPYLT